MASKKLPVSEPKTLRVVEGSFGPSGQGIPLAPDGPGTDLVSETYNFSLQEALLVLNHLSQKALLCTKCGYRWAEQSNQYHSHCNHCMNPSMQYNALNRGSYFEKNLCAGLQRFVEAHFVS